MTMDGNLGSVGAYVGLLSDVIRYLSFLLDMIAYSLIPIVFDLIYKLYDLPATVAGIEAINTLSKSIYSLLAIFMFFKVAFSLLGMLVDPNMIADKEKGAGKIVSNIFITLVLIVVVPFAFDYASKAQYIIMGNGQGAGNGLIEKALFGENYTGDDQLTLGKRISLSVWGLFLGKTTETGNGAKAYKAIFEDKNIDEPYINLFANINATTNDQAFIERLLWALSGPFVIIDVVQGFFEGVDRYQVAYVALVSTAAGFYLLWSFVKMCIDVSYRSIKLYALRMLAPVAIISYIDPKSGKNGVFSKWLAECVKTYVSLFVRIFVFAIASVILNDIDISNSEQTFIERLFFTLAVVAFLKTAPKFIDGILGTELSKESESKFGSDLLKQGLGGIGMATVGGAIGLASAKKLGYNGGRGFWEGAKSGFTGGVEAVNKKDPIGVISGLAKAGNGANAMRKYYGLPTAAEARKQKAEADLALKSAKDYVGVRDNVSKKKFDKMSDEDFTAYLNDKNTILSDDEKVMKARWENAKNDTEREAVMKDFTSNRFKNGYKEKDAETGQVKTHSGYTDKDASGKYIRSDAEESSRIVDELTAEKGKRYRASLGTVDAIHATFDKDSEIGKLYLEEEENNRKKIIEENKAEFWSRRADDARDDASAGGTGEIYVNQFGTKSATKKTLYNVTPNTVRSTVKTKDATGNEVETTKEETTYTMSYKDETGTTQFISGVTEADREAKEKEVEALAMKAGGFVEKVDRETLSARASTANSRVDFYGKKIKEKADAREDRIKHPQSGKEARDARSAQLIEAGKRRSG